MVNKVVIESDALEVCMVHALSTEKEEVMGLLIGEVEDHISHIHAVIMLTRLDKRKDRVEISPEQLSEASTEAESKNSMECIFHPSYDNIGLQTRMKRPMRVIGWYHSHPHITVWPSHVDIRTQAMYQLMDKDFVGLIVSCFNDDTAHLGQMQVTCFQSANISSTDPPRYERIEVPQEVVPCDESSEACLHALLCLPQILLEEEVTAYTKTLRGEDQDLLTAIQNASIFSRSVIQIIEIICSPLLQSMETKIHLKKMKINELQKKHEDLEKQLSMIIDDEEKK